MQGPGFSTLRRRCVPFAILAGAWLALAAPALALAPDKPFHDYVRNTWSIEQGLPQITVLAIAQDADGYLWFGTQAGLSRFDGVRFVNYGIDNTPELPGVYVQALLADPEGRLWVGTSRGVAVREHGRFRVLQAGTGKAALNVRQIVRADDGRILVASTRGVFEISGDGLRLLHEIPANALLPLPEGLWIAGDGGTFLDTRGKLAAYPLPPDARTASVNHMIQAQGRLWAGTGQGLFWLDKGHWQRYAADPWLSSQPVEALFEDRDENLWVALSENMVRLRDGHVTEKIAGDHGAIAWRAIQEDREGNLWLGSMLNGVSRVWSGWTRRYSTAEGLRNPILWSVVQAADGTIYAGTNDGVETLANGRFRPLLAGARLPHPSAYTLLPERNQLWIGTRSGVALYRDGRVRSMPVLAPMQHAQIGGILRDRRGRLWFGTSEGLFALEGEHLTRYAESEGLADPRIRVLHQTRDGRLLVGTHSGLYEWRDGRAVLLGPGKDADEPYDITAIHELPGGQLVVGSLDEEELFLSDRGRWHRFGRNEGLPLSAAFFMADDAAGFLWVAGLRGIYRVPVSDLLAHARDPAAPLHAEMLLNERGDRHGGQKGDCCNGAGNARGFIREGALWLPTRDGIVTMATAGITRNDVVPATRIERIRVEDVWRDLLPGQAIALPARARDLGFEFTTLSFQASDHMDIRFRLVGYDKTWRTLEDPNRRSISYTNLPPGHYTLEVIGGNNSGRVPAQPTRLELDIRPWFYETLWFRATVVALLALLAWLGYRLLLLRFRRQRGLLESLVQQRTLALQEANARLQEVSVTDPLTGLRNRRYLAAQIPTDIAFYERTLTGNPERNEVMVFALLDIDHFKAINDTHGHEGGDAILCQFGQVLRAIVRDGDYVARWGGEEFLLVFRPMPRSDVAALGARICATIASHRFSIDGGPPLTVTTSVGLVEHPLLPQQPQLLGWEQMVALADRALYWIKKHGRNGWACYRARPGSRVDLDGAARSTPDDLLKRGVLVLHSDRDANPPDR